MNWKCFSGLFTYYFVLCTHVGFTSFRNWVGNFVNLYICQVVCIIIIIILIVTIIILSNISGACKPTDFGTDSEWWKSMWFKDLHSVESSIMFKSCKLSSFFLIFVAFWLLISLTSLATGISVSKKHEWKRTSRYSSCSQTLEVKSLT